MSIKRERAVAVAKDVLKIMKKPTVEASQSTYITAPLEITKGDEDKEVQELLPDIMKDCKVCALGACMLAKIGLYGDCKVRDIFENITNVYEYYSPTSKLNGLGENIHDELRSIFSYKQMDMIESAFEQSEMYSYGGLDDAPKYIHDSIAFGDKYEDDTDRLRAIMRNIIRNAGQFIPKKKKVAKVRK